MNQKVQRGQNQWKIYMYIFNVSKQTVLKMSDNIFWLHAMISTWNSSVFNAAPKKDISANVEET